MNKKRFFLSLAFFTVLYLTFRVDPGLTSREIMFAIFVFLIYYSLDKLAFPKK